jgi:hypothetical protein
MRSSESRDSADGGLDSRGMAHVARRAFPLSVVAMLGAAACGDDVPYPFDGLVMASGPSPFSAGCNGRPQDGTNHPGSEVEPYLAVDPRDPLHLIGVWQQDRWSNGGANGTVTAVSLDGGVTWTRTAVPFSRCSGAAAGSEADYERATDPWVTFSPDGTAHQIALALDRSGNGARNAVLASRSDDGGFTWTPPSVLISDDNPDVFNDKESITADPRDARRVYAVWDRLTGLLRPREPIGTGPTWFARTNGKTWEPARIIYDPGRDAQTIGNQIVVLPDGTLINAFTRITGTSTQEPRSEVATIRSTDQGVTWSEPVVVSTMRFFAVRDPDDDTPIRSGAIIAEVDADPRTGALYVAWEDLRFTSGGRNGIVLASSTDGGVTWTAPRLVSPASAHYSFTPGMAVAADGALGLSYFSVRSARDVMAVAVLATSRDGGGTWSEEELSEEFDLRSTRFGGAYFLGDYQGLVAAGETFVPFFSAALASGTPTAVFVRPLESGRGGARRAAQAPVSSLAVTEAPRTQGALIEPLASARDARDVRAFRRDELEPVAGAESCGLGESRGED